MHPTYITLRLPRGACCVSLSDASVGLISGRDVEGSLTAVDTSSDPGFHGCSLVPFARVFNLVYRYPHICQLYLLSITVQHPRRSTPDHIPWFSLLESLTIKPLFDPTYDVGIVIARGHFLALLARMPLLRKLRVYGPKGPPHRDDDAALDDLPCKLETLLLFGSFPASTSVHIILQSSSTLRDLRINARGYTPADEAHLLAAIAQAAPQLRFIALRLRGEADMMPPIEPVVAALTRLDELHFELPRNATLQEALDALRDTPVRALSVHCAGDLPRPRAPSDVDVSRLRMTALRSIELPGFAFDDDVRRNLVVYCRARQIRCFII